MSFQDLANNRQAPLTTSTTSIAVGDNDIFRIRDILQGVQELNHDDGKFYRVMSTLGSVSVSQPKFEWGEDDVLAVQTCVNNGAGYSASATSIVVDDALPFVANHILQNTRTEEHIYVSAVNYGTNTLTVTRGFAGTAGIAMLDNDALLSLGAQLGEEADANLGNGSVPTEKFNYIQRLSETVSVTDMQDAVQMMDGVAQMPREIIRKTLKLQRELNNVLIYGKKSKATSPIAANGTVYTTDGFMTQATENELNLQGNNGLLEWPVLNRWLNPLFEDSASSGRKMLFAGEALYSAFSRLAWDRFNFRDTMENEFGGMVTRIKTDNGGTVDIIRDRYGFPTGTDRSGAGIVVDLANVNMTELVGQSLSWRPNVQDNDSHVRKDEIWGTAGLCLKHAGTHGVVRGASAQY